MHIYDFKTNIFFTLIYLLPLPTPNIHSNHGRHPLSVFRYKRFRYRGDPECGSPALQTQGLKDLACIILMTMSYHGTGEPY